MKILIVVGARPNFMKVAPIIRELGNLGAQYKLIHTEQHYDKNMSAVFFSEFGLRKPDWHLGVGSGTHADQTAKIMQSFASVKAQVNTILVQQKTNAMLTKRSDQLSSIT